MRGITKGAEPPSLTAHRKTTHCDYDNYEDKDALRNALVTEQRGLCCYCMDRIHNGPTTMKIEHWRCRDLYPAKQLAYRNLLGACLGGKGQPHYLQHCDTRKGNCGLRWNPANPDHHVETRLRYEMDGRIRSDEPQFDAELDEVLNLNLAVLRNNRKSALDAVLLWWRAERRRLRGPVPRAGLEKRLHECAGGTGDLAPFSPVAAWWLRQRLAVMPA